MNTEHLQEDKQLYSNGSLYSVDPEFASLVSKEHFIELRNMRLASLDGHDYIPVSVPGETLLYEMINNPCIGGDDTALSTNYKCMFADWVNGYLFEIWCDKIKSLPSLFRINGKVVAKSASIPFSVDHGIQSDKDEGAPGGEICVSDFNSPPQLYNIKDLLENSGISFTTGQVSGSLTCTQQYFTLYNLTDYTVSLQMQSDMPVFVRITNSVPAAAYGGSAKIIGAGGIKAGSHQYAIRFGTKSGDRTLFSKSTPLIPVPYGIGIGSTNYYGEKTYGAKAGADTLNGIHFRFRITNLNNYDTCEIRRRSYIAGSPIGSEPIDEIIYSFKISDQEISIQDFWDIGATGVPLTNNDKAVTIGAIKKAKAVQYIGNELHLFNIEYESKVVEPTFISSPYTMYPGVRCIADWGHKDPYNCTYYPSLMHGEKHGWAVEFRDHQGGLLYSVPITGEIAKTASRIWGGKFSNFQMPNRRDVIFNAPDAYITPVFPTAGNAQLVTSGCYEAFDLHDADDKTDLCQYKNISSDGGKDRSDVAEFGCATSSDDGVTDIEGGTQYGFINKIRPNWQPFHPTSETDGDSSGLDFIVNHKVSTAGVSLDVDYRPEGFKPSYFSLAMRLTGITNIPSNVASFNIVRTRPAGRVLMQGLGMYSLIEAGFGDSADNYGRKEKNAFWFYSPDSATGLASMQDVIDNPSNYQVQLISPLGFFSEMYNARTNEAPNAGRDSHVDIISYARVQYEDGSINAGDVVGNVGFADGYVSFGRWRGNNDGKNFSALSDKGNHLFEIDDVKIITTKSGRQSYFRIQLNEDVYKYDTIDSVSERDFQFNSMRKFHEPFYVLNIIRKNADVDESQNQNEYVETEHFQKISSIIGRSDGLNNNGNGYLLVDERFDDVYSFDTSERRYVWITDTDGTESKWVEDSHLSGSAITNILADISGGTNTSGLNADGKLKGLYTKEYIAEGGELRFWKINFDTAGIPSAAYMPETGSIIRVKYDTSAPCNVHGGDTVIGESVFAPIDSELPAGGVGGQATYQEQFALGLGWPYYNFGINPRYFIMNNTSGSNTIQDGSITTKYSAAYIRQMLIMFACSSRSHIPFAFNNNTDNNGLFQSFPSVNYVMRPHQWDAEQKPSDQNVYKEYEDVYPEELDDEKLPVNWIYGGFRIKQVFENINIDYSHGNGFSSVSAPAVGFEEQLSFTNMQIWSAKRTPNEQNDPGVKTFLPKASRFLEAKYGAIKKAWSYYSEHGNTLVVIAEYGVCEVLINKFIMRQTTGGAIGVGSGGDQNIFEENWIRQDAGLPDELWRTFASKDNEAWFANYNGVYKISRGSVEDVSGPYYFRIHTDLLSKLQREYRDDLTAFFDRKHNEYWLNYKRRPIVYTSVSPSSVIITVYQDVDDSVYEVWNSVGDIRLPADTYGIVSLYIVNKRSSTITIKNPNTTTLTTLTAGKMARCTRSGSTWSAVTNQTLDPAIYGNITFVFMDDSEKKKQAWIGFYDYDGNEFSYISGRIFQSKPGGTYELVEGATLNGADMTYSLLGASSGGGQFQDDDKEFKRIRINSNIKPETVKFYDSLEDYRAGNPSSEMSLALNGVNYLKDYRGFEQWIPRKKTEPYNRQQGRVMLYLVEDSSGVKFRIVDTTIKFKKLK
jgi:hypothetical protein